MAPLPEDPTELRTIALSWAQAVDHATNRGFPCPSCGQIGFHRSACVVAAALAEAGVVPIHSDLSCAACGARVIVADDIVLRACNAHDGAGIIASVGATATGDGTCDPPKEPDGGVR